MGKAVLLALCTFSIVSSAASLTNLLPQIPPAPPPIALPPHGGGTRAAVLTKHFQLQQHAGAPTPVNVWGGRSGVGRVKATEPLTNLHQSSIVYERRRSPTMPSVLSRWFQAYVTSCKESPFVTKSLTAGVIMGLGDFMAQRIEASTAPMGLQCFQMVRFGSFIMTGLFFKGPFLHFWYKKLAKLGSWLSVRHGKSKAVQLSAQIFADQTVGVSIFYALYFYAYDIFESLMSFRAPMLACTTHKLTTKFFSVMIANYYVWPFVTYVNFRHVPNDLRVLVSSVVAVFFNIYLCSSIAGCH